MGKALLLLAVPVVGLYVICGAVQSAGEAVGLLDPIPTRTPLPVNTPRPTRTSAPTRTAGPTSTPEPPTATTEAPTPEPPSPEPPTPEPPTPASPTPEPPVAVEPTLAPPAGGGGTRGGTFPIDGGSNCPPDYPIKGNHSSSGEWIYHRPGQQAYSRTDPEECFATAADAEAAGYRAAQR